MSAAADAGLATEHPPKAWDIFSLAWPMTIKAIFLAGTVVIDGWLVSSLGETALAAMGLAAAIGGMALGFIFAFSHAMQIRTAQAFGTSDPIFIRSALASGLTVSLFIGVLGVIAIFALGGHVIAALAQTPQIADLAWSYLVVFSLVVLFEAAGQCLSSYFNGCGRTRLPLYGYCLSVPINIGTSVALIHGLWGLPAWGVMGAAAGSAIAVAVQVMYFASQVWRIDKNLFDVKGWRNDTFAKTVRRHLTFSLPIAATFISATLSSHVCTLIYARMTLFEFAAMTLITPWNMVVGQIAMQWNQAAGIFVAQLLGKGASEDMLDKFMSTVWRGAFVAAGIVSLVFVGLGLSVNFLYGELSSETRFTLITFLPILILSAIPRSTNSVCGNTLRASGDTIYVMHIFLWSQWLFRVPVTALAVLVFNVPAVWVLSIMLAEELLKFWPFHARMFRGDWKRAKVSE